MKQVKGSFEKSLQNITNRPFDGVSSVYKRLTVLFTYSRDYFDIVIIQFLCVYINTPNNKRLYVMKNLRR